MVPGGSSAYLLVDDQRQPIKTTGGTHETLSWCCGRCGFVGWHDGGCDGCPRRWTWWRWRRRIRWRPHGRWVPRAIAGKRPFDATTGLQSIESIHCACLARDPRLAGKPWVGIWEWLKRFSTFRRIMNKLLLVTSRHFSCGIRRPYPQGRKTARASGANADQV
jgi:hypothetical protein